MDTGSSYNLIGKNLVKHLETKLKSAGQKLSTESARKFFQFGGGQLTKSAEMIRVPMNMSGKMIIMNVYVVEQNVPFLMGGKFFRGVDTKIDMKLPALLLRDGRQIMMKKVAT